MNTFWSSFLGAFTGTLLNLIEIGLLVTVIRKLMCILKQFKQFKEEGDDDSWLK